MYKPPASSLGAAHDSAQKLRWNATTETRPCRSRAFVCQISAFCQRASRPEPGTQGSFGWHGIKGVMCFEESSS